MLDVSKKIKTLRTAEACATLTMKAETLQMIHDGKIPKGNPLEVAKVAAVQAVKNTSRIIPYCHPLPIDFAGVEYAFHESGITVTVTAKALYKTGVEMEALTGASVAALTMYDMLKMVDETMEITGVRLVKKRGGKSDFREAYEKPLSAAVLVMSDSISAGKKTDASGKMIVQCLQQNGLDVKDYRIIPDDFETIGDTLIMYSDEMQVDLVMTTGGTGFSPRDCTPEVMKAILEREIPGIPEAIRSYGQERTPYSMLSRAKAGIRGRTIIINLPGSKKGVAEALDALFPSVLHSFKMLWMEGSWNHAHEELAGR